MRSRAVPFLLMACLLALSCGCGSRARLTKAQYEQQVTQIGSRFTDTLQKVCSSPALQTPASLKAAADAIRTGADAMRKAADDLDAINPPPDAEHDHGLLVDGFRGFAEDLDGFADDAQAGNLAKIRAFDQAVSAATLPSMVKIKKAIDELKALGYRVGSPSPSPSA